MRFFTHLQQETAHVVDDVLARVDADVQVWIFWSTDRMRVQLRWVQNPNPGSFASRRAFGMVRTLTITVFPDDLDTVEVSTHVDSWQESNDSNFWPNVSGGAPIDSSLYQLSKEIAEFFHPQLLAAA